ncbi:MAG: lipopolysaccharide biosynthesis protein [Novosphingobium sp.]|nr:lipopolysaccharide biosynthesis protein [Novosphingobium sp.]
MIRRRLHNAIQTRFFRNIVVGAYGQAIQLGAQLVLVPVMIAHWGLETYGVWLMLLAIPAYLTMADFGIASAAMNEMVALTAKGRNQRAAHLFRAVQRMQLLAISGVTALAALVVFGIQPTVLDSLSGVMQGDQRMVILLLVLYGLMALPRASIMAAFSASDRHAFGGYLFLSANLVEATATIALVIAGEGIRAIVIAYLAIAIAVIILGLVLLHRTAPWLREKSHSRTSMRQLYRLARPAGAFMLLPAANATLFQGSSAMLGSAGGPASVPALTVPRTLTRLALQIATIVSAASIQRFTVANARNDHDRMTSLLAVNLGVIGIVVLPAALIMIAAGPQLIAAWTGGNLTVSRWLITPLAISVVLAGIWTVLANALISLNRHTSYAFSYLVLSLSGVAVGGLLASKFGALGMAWAVAAIDFGMVVLICRIAGQAGVLVPGDLAMAGRIFLKAINSTRRRERP